MLRRIAPVLVLLLTANPLWAEDGSLVGKKVMPAKAGVKLRLPDAKGKRVEVAPKEAVYTVTEQKDGTIRLTARGQSGWAERDEWVPLADAPAHYTDLIRADAKDAWAWNYRGIAWKERGELDNAMKDFEEVVKLDPKSASAYLNLGNVWSLKRDYERAIREFDEAIRLDPKYATAYFNRGNARAAMGEWDRAIDDYDEAIKLEPKSPAPYNQRANAWVEKGEYDAAIKDFTEAFRHDPGHPGSVYNRGRIWNAKGEYQKALDDLDEALRINPKFEYALAMKARLLATCPQEKFRNGKLAVELAKHAVEVTKGKEGDSLDALAAAYAEVGEFDKAVEYQKKALEDKRFEKEWGDEARARIELYQKKMPARN